MENAILFEHNTIPKRINVSSHKFSIGRGLDNSYVVEDLSVSRRHSILEFFNDQWYLYDMSSNGTWLNDCLIDKNGPRPLNDGDIIKLSESCQYTFKIKPSDVLSNRNLSEEEIAIAAEEVIASVDAFNSEFPTDPDDLNAAVSVPPIAVSVSLSSENPTVPLEQTTGNQPSTSMGNSNVSLSSSSVSQEQASSSAKVSKYSVEFVEDELQCSICTELFVKAVTLSCSHTFCSYCIAQWQKTKKDCPICRTNITNKCPTIILDSYIDKIVETGSDEYKKYRQQIVAQREASIVPQTPSTSVEKVLGLTATTPRGDLIEISSEEGDFDEEDDDVDMSDSSESDSDDDSSGNERKRPYYGGYGRCYKCGAKGHWANNCPSRRTRY